MPNGHAGLPRNRPRPRHIARHEDRFVGSDLDRCETLATADLDDPAHQNGFEFRRSDPPHRNAADPRN
jgi:hypothetical protein